MKPTTVVLTSAYGTAIVTGYGCNVVGKQIIEADRVPGRAVVNAPDRVVYPNVHVVNMAAPERI